MQDALGEPFVSYAGSLFNDVRGGDAHAALARLTPQTEAVAMDAGWRWSIPLTSRTGNGYVYSSRHITDAVAEAELRAAIGADADIPARVLHMKVGRVARSWVRNCLAAGWRRGSSSRWRRRRCISSSPPRSISRAPAPPAAMARRTAIAFNAAIAERYDGIRDYIVAHYRMNQWPGTPYRR